MRAALIPMKELTQAKMRLADVLDRHERQELALAMLTDVVTACIESGRFDRVAVLSRDSEALWQARELGGYPLAEPATGTGLNDGLTFGVRYLARRVGVVELLIVPADIPLITAEDLRAAVDAIAESGDRLAIVRARDGGTNAMAMRPAESVAMRFGPASAEAHIGDARARGIDVVELSLERVAFDVDSPEDLEALPSLPAGAATSGWIAARSDYVRRHGD